MNKVRYLLVIVFWLSAAVHASEPLVFGEINESFDQSVSAEILKVVYAKAGIPIKVVSFPGKRSLRESNQGRADGEVNRITEVGADNANLMRVPTSINYIEQSVFSNHLSFNVTDCNALKHYNVGIVRGEKHAKLCTQDVANITLFNYHSQALKLLNTGRLDLVITSKLNGLYLSRVMGLHSVKLLSPYLQRIPLYHFLNRKHKALIGKIDHILSDMQKTGELTELREKIIHRLFLRDDAIDYGHF